MRNRTSSAPRVTAHSGYLAGARAGAEAGVDSLEHGFELDADTARIMAAIYQTLLHRLESAAYPVFGEPLRLPRRTKAWIALRVWCATMTGLPVRE